MKTDLEPLYRKISRLHNETSKKSRELLNLKYRLGNVIMANRFHKNHTKIIKDCENKIKESKDK